MPAADFFNQFGFYTVRNFLDRDFCARVREEIGNATNREGGVIPYGETGEEIREHFKRRLEAEMSEETIGKIKRKLLDEIPAVEENYGVELRDLQPLKFATYRTGDFYKAHVDRFNEKNTPEALKDIPPSAHSTERKVAVIIFLIDESKEPMEDAYCGGNLTFHGLMDNTVFGDYGLPIVGECGLLVTFPPVIMHEVTPVTFGHRYSIATWYI